MTPTALRHRIDELGLSQKGLARLLDVNARSVRRWVSGQNDIPPGLEGRLDEVTEDEVMMVMRPSRMEGRP